MLLLHHEHGTQVLCNERSLADPLLLNNPRLLVLVILQKREKVAGLLEERAALVPRFQQALVLVVQLLQLLVQQGRLFVVGEHERLRLFVQLFDCVPDRVHLRLLDRVLLQQVFHVHQVDSNVITLEFVLEIN